MVTASLSDFRTNQAALLDAAQREPVEIRSRGSRRRAVVVSPAFFDRAVAALEDALDVRQAASARLEEGEVSHEDLMAELGL
jgi:prevent-host-death family protein